MLYQWFLQVEFCKRSASFYQFKICCLSLSFHTPLFLWKMPHRSCLMYVYCSKYAFIWVYLILNLNSSNFLSFYVVLWADIPKQISSSFLQSPSLSRNLKTKFKIENWWTGQDVTEKKYHDRSKKGEKTAGRKGRAIFCVSIKGEKRQWKNVTEQCQEMLNIWLHKCCVFFISRVLTACPHASVLPPAFPTISYR